ncbi:Short-chain dehydrogenase/reductase SDR [Penicillium canescens]|uniref:Short-chain dehydrogenase/reductase SDR n=1 Tax=Penicillium canescens TaxID=5083 RepID=A0AAD6IDZ0_PENCN|nr:Short-chain dehydrogenase/reductase SDR [Penicillium canescens]KAJ6044146.1 Short-chain dehydrogenase/reductase SDR [Penicillium canescens]KAJ6055616.1 Short-chain dehydrogenase/reductase SDR [Penicillium canescens]KAJ6074565.1 Short-chain dehydrogenase/reductase SDR [Penicillium canescens]
MPPRAKLRLASLPASAKILMVEVWELDLNSYASVKRSNIQIDFALLNAGVANFNFTVKRSPLLPMLSQQTADNPNHSRPVISIVGSETAAWAKFKEAQEGIPLITVLDDRTHFDMGDRYYISKLLYRLFFLEPFHTHRSSAQRSQGTILNLVNPEVWDSLNSWPMRVLPEYLILLKQDRPSALLLSGYYTILLRPLQGKWLLRGPGYETGRCDCATEGRGSPQLWDLIFGIPQIFVV